MSVGLEKEKYMLKVHKYEEEDTLQGLGQTTKHSG